MAISMLDALKNSSKYGYLADQVATDKPAAKPIRAEKPATPSTGKPSMLDALKNSSKYGYLASAVSNPVIAEALNYLGTPYRWGGNDKAGIDCSGLTCNIFSKSGVKLPRTAAEQFKATVRVDKPEPGDLVFLKDTGGRSGITHVGVAIGGGKWIHAAAGNRRQVIVDSLDTPYNKKHFAGFGRIKENAQPAQKTASKPYTGTPLSKDAERNIAAWFFHSRETSPEQFLADIDSASLNWNKDAALHAYHNIRLSDYSDDPLVKNPWKSKLGTVAALRNYRNTALDIGKSALSGYQAGKRGFTEAVIDTATLGTYRPNLGGDPTSRKLATIGLSGAVLAAGGAPAAAVKTAGANAKNASVGLKGAAKLLHNIKNIGAGVKAAPGAAAKAAAIGTVGGSGVRVAGRDLMSDYADALVNSNVTHGEPKGAWPVVRNYIQRRVLETEGERAAWNNDPERAALMNQAAKNIALLPESAALGNEDVGLMKTLLARGGLVLLGEVVGQMARQAPEMAGGVAGVAAGPVGALIPSFIGSKSVEQASKLKELMADQGVDLNNVDSIKQFLDDDTKIRKAKFIARKRGIAVGLVDAVFEVAAAAVVLKGLDDWKEAAKTVPQRLVRGASAGGTALGLQGVGEMASETSGQFAAGEPFNKREVALEGILGLGAGTVTTAGQAAVMAPIAAAGPQSRAYRAIRKQLDNEATQFRSPELWRLVPVEGGYKAVWGAGPKSQGRQTTEVFATKAEASKQGRQTTAYKQAQLEIILKQTGATKPVSLQDTPDGGVELTTEGGGTAKAFLMDREDIAKWATNNIEAVGESLIAAGRMAPEQWASLTPEQQVNAAIQSAGSFYSNGAIYIRRGADVGEVTHEVMHWFKAAGVLTDAEMNTLADFARGEYGIPQEVSSEEAAAIAVQRYAETSQKIPGDGLGKTIRRILARIAHVFRTLTDTKWKRARPILAEMTEGIMQGRPVQATATPIAPSAPPQVSATPIAPSAPPQAAPLDVAVTPAVTPLSDTSAPMDAEVAPALEPFVKPVPTADDVRRRADQRAQSLAQELAEASKAADQELREIAKQKKALQRQASKAIKNNPERATELTAERDAAIARLDSFAQQLQQVKADIVEQIGVQLAEVAAQAERDAVWYNAEQVRRLEQELDGLQGQIKSYEGRKRLAPKERDRLQALRDRSSAIEDELAALRPTEQPTEIAEAEPDQSPRFSAAPPAMEPGINTSIAESLLDATASNAYNKGAAERVRPLPEQSARTSRNLIGYSGGGVNSAANPVPQIPNADLIYPGESVAPEITQGEAGRRRLRDIGPDILPIGDAIRFSIKSKKWETPDYNEDAFRAVNNRIALEVGITERLFGKIEGTFMAPAAKGQPKLVADLKVLMNHIYAAVQDGRAARYLDPTVDADTLANERGLVGAERELFLADVRAMRQPGIWGDNGKAGLDISFLLATCDPTTPCNACYAAENMIRASIVRKQYRSTLLMLADPERFGKEAADELKSHRKRPGKKTPHGFITHYNPDGTKNIEPEAIYPHDEVPFARLLGAGDLTSDEVVRAFNTLAAHADRPLHIFSRHHDMLAKLKGTQRAPFLKMGSVDAQLLKHYGIEKLTANWKENRIANGFLHTDVSEIPGMLALQSKGGLRLVLSATEKTHQALAKITLDPDLTKLKELIATATPEVRDILSKLSDAELRQHAKEMLMSSCPCDANERTYVGSCRSCMLSTLGCGMAFADQAITPDGEMVSIQDMPEGSVPVMQWGQWTQMGDKFAAAAYQGVYASMLAKNRALVELGRKEFQKGIKKRVALKDIRFPGNVHYATSLDEIESYSNNLALWAKRSRETGTFYLPGGDIQPEIAYEMARRVDPSDTEAVARIRDLTRVPYEASKPKFSVAPPVDSPEFKRWFGNSKVVNPDGSPKVVYHRTYNAFSVFDASRLGENTDDNATGDGFAETAHLGFWFNSNKEVRWDESPIVMPVYLSIQSPYEVESLQHLANQLATETADAYVAGLKEQGYDGIVVMDDEEFGGTSYIAFAPTQIKSATGNQGTYDPENPDIRFAVRKKGLLPGQEDALQGYAANINMDKMQFTNAEYAEDVIPMFRADVERMALKIEQQRRGVRHHDQTYESARLKAMGITPKMLARIRPGKTMNAEEMAAVEMILIGLGEDVRDAGAIYNATGAQEDLAIYLEKLRQKEVVLKALAGLKAETGRALEFMKQIKRAYRETLTPKERVEQLLTETGAELDIVLAKHLASLPDDDIFGLHKLLMQHVGIKRKWGDMLHAYLYSNMLSGMTAQSANAVGNLFNQVLNELAAKPLAAGIDAVRSIVTGEERSNYFMPAVYAATRELAVAEAIDSFKAATTAMMEVAKHGLTKEQAARFDLHFNRDLPGGMRNPINWPLRSVGMNDAFMRSLAESIYINEQVTTKAINQLKRQKRPVNAETIMEEFRAIKSDIANHADIIEGAKAWGHEMLLTRKVKWKVFTYLLAAIDTEIGNTGFRPGRLFVPFSRVPLNIAWAGAEWSPAGIAAMAKADTKYNKNLALSRAVIGTSLMLLLYKLAKMGLAELTDDPEKNRGVGSLMTASGRKPNSIRLFGRYVPIQEFGPLAPALYGVASAAEAWKAGKTGETRSAFLEGLQGMVKGTLEATWLQGMNTMLNLLTGDSWQVTSLAERSGSNIAGQFVPMSGLLGNIANSTDRNMRDFDTGNTWKNIPSRVAVRIPGLRQKYPKRLDTLGREMPQNPTGFAAYSRLFGSEALTTDPVAEELISMRYSPGAAARQFTRDKIPYELTPEQWRQYQRELGQAVHKELGKLIESQDYQSLENNEDRIEELKRVAAAARKPVTAAWRNKIVGEEQGEGRPGRRARRTRRSS